MNYTSACTDLTNIATMQIELIIGIIGAILITWFFLRREKNQKKRRGKILTKTLIKEGMLRLLFELEVIQITPEKGEDYDMELVNLQWKDVVDIKNKILPLYAISAEVISIKQQIVISSILDSLERHIPFNEVLTEVSVLEGKIMKFLSLCTDELKEVIEEDNKRLEKEIERARKEEPEWYKKCMEEGKPFNPTLVMEIMIKDNNELLEKAKNYED